MKIRFLGAARTVTGSCFYLSLHDQDFLVDCGMYQGKDSEFNRAAFAFNPEKISYLFLTHAHIDHSGLIPKLVKEGFKGRILATSATSDLSEIMLNDSAHLQEKDAEWLTKKSLRSGKDEVIKPLYTIDDVRAAISLFDRKSYGRIESLGENLRYRFIEAGHILGSGTLQIWYQDNSAERTIIFSGDIGKKGNPIINDPQLVERADFVVIESTYGNRLHKSMGESIDELVEVIESTFKRGGNVVMPSFAVGRTQDILYILNKLVREGRIMPIDVYVDSPLAEEATKVYLAHPECFDQEAMKMLRDGKGDALRLHFTASVEESQNINSIKSGALIIAGGGMCEGGRIRHHLKHNLWRPECSIIFVGFQAEGTLGREIVDGREMVRVLGEEIAVRAKVFTIGGFSAHADQRELLEWLGSISNRPMIFIVHGEEKVAFDFEKAVRERFGLRTHVPSKGEEYEI
ncbi:MAG: MBL fold metallo-hydrolase [Nitrospirota bacterium]